MKSWETALVVMAMHLSSVAGICYLVTIKAHWFWPGILIFSLVMGIKSKGDKND